MFNKWRAVCSFQSHCKYFQTDVISLVNPFSLLFTQLIILKCKYVTEIAISFMFKELLMFP